MAVRFVRWVLLAAATIFFGVAATYGPDSRWMRYGRTRSVSWVMHQASRLDETTIRSHDGGRVMWIVGSSITRDSFDEPAVNEMLSETQSPYRVVKLGFTRGAPGVSIGLAERLPIRQGDIVATTVAAENFRQGWVQAFGPPADLLMKTVSPADMWSIPSWTLADKLEQAAAYPTNFYAWHEEIMAGIWNAGVDVIWFLRKPRKTRAGYKTRHRDVSIEHKSLDRARAAGSESVYFIPEGGLDFSSEQFNVRGIERYRALAAERGAAFVMLSVPPRQEYVARFLAPSVREEFAEWLEMQAETVYFPQPDEADYYDWKHPGNGGRKLLGVRLVDWLATRARGEPVRSVWPAPGYNADAPPPRPVAKEQP